MIDLRVDGQDGGDAAESRGRRAGWSSGFAAICASISGEAFTSSQSWPFSLTAIEDCVRRVAFSVPRAHAVAVAAVAVPLREAAACR